MHVSLSMHENQVNQIHSYVYRPLSEFWELSDKPQECINQSAHIIAASIINTFTDWVVVLLPIKAALCLNIPTKQSSMIIFLFGVGILASSAGIARTYFTWVLATDFDITWNSWTVWFSSAIELNLGIVCIPTHSIY